MVVLNRIYTRTGDNGTTALASGERVNKHNLRVDAFGTVDETNAAIGVARLHTGAESALADFDPVLALIQNDLFDLGADLAMPEDGVGRGYEPLRITPPQVERLERDIDTYNAGLAPLRSFVLPAGTPAAAHLHVARTVCRRAERLVVELSTQPGEVVSAAVLHYLNRLSDLLFVLARLANTRAGGDVLWVPAAGRGT